MAFESTASNLVADFNGVRDIFVHDRSTGTTTRISEPDSGILAPGGASLSPAISADGRFVAFASDATNLVVGDTNGLRDVFVRDRSSGTTTRVSVPDGGSQSTGGGSFAPAISGDGVVVAFGSDATNLVAGDTNGLRDIFVHARSTGRTSRVSLAGGGAQATGGISFAPAISGDGRFVAFASAATDLVVGDTNGRQDIFVHDRLAGRTTRVSVSDSGTQARGGSSFTPAISADGQLVAFQSAAENLVTPDTNGQRDIFVHDRSTRRTTRVSSPDSASQANSFSAGRPAISGDGRFVAFESVATNLIADDSNGRQDIFVHDRSTGAMTRVSLTDSGSQATGGSFSPALSGDGQFVAFASDAADLVAGDSNARRDVFVRDRGATAGFFGSWKRVRLRCRPRSRPRRCILKGRLRIANPGLRRARRSRVYFYLSKNRKLDRRDRRIRKRSLAPLKAGRTRVIRFRRVVSRRAAKRFLIARLDATNRVKEPNEKDNVVVSRRLRRR